MIIKMQDNPTFCLAFTELLAKNVKFKLKKLKSKLTPSLKTSLKKLLFKPFTMFTQLNLRHSRKHVAMRSL
jgi:hypothetical protein